MNKILNNYFFIMRGIIIIMHDAKKALDILEENMDLVENNDWLQFLYIVIGGDYGNYYSIGDDVIEICTNPEINIPIKLSMSKTDIDNLTLDHIFTNDYVDSVKIFTLQFFIKDKATRNILNYKVCELLSNKYKAIVQKLIDCGFKCSTGDSGVYFDDSPDYDGVEIKTPTIYVNSYRIEDDWTLFNDQYETTDFKTVEELEEILKKQK